LQLVGFELHPRAAAVAEAAAGELGGELLGGDLHPGDHAFQHGYQGGTVGLTRGDPAQHGWIFARGPQPPPAAVARVRSQAAASIDGPCGTTAGDGGTTAGAGTSPSGGPRLRHSRRSATRPVITAARTAAVASADHDAARSTAPSGAASLTSPRPSAPGRSTCTRP